MKSKIMLAVAFMALLVFGTATALAAESICAAPANVFEEALGLVTPMAGCTRTCSWCVKYGHNGACTIGGGCC
jgi:hypothetical protein